MIMAVTIAIIFNMLLLMIRMFKGPTIFDRILVTNSFGTSIVVLILLLGEVQNTEFYVDIALIYALINFVAMIAFLRYFETHPLNDKVDEHE